MGSFDNAPWMAAAPSSDALREDKEPRNLAIGVRATLAMTMLVVDLAATTIIVELCQECSDMHELVKTSMTHFLGSTQDKKLLSINHLVRTLDHPSRR
jgi:hypothetical protein